MSSTITICGNVVRDPELRRTANNTATTTWSVAVNRRIVGKSGTVTETVSYFNVVAWSTLAEHVAASVKKGARVVVTGRLDQRTFDVAAEGGETTRRTVFELVADDVGASMRFNDVAIQRATRPAPVVRPPVFVDAADAPELVGAGARNGSGSGSGSGSDEPF